MISDDEFPFFSVHLPIQCRPAHRSRRRRLVPATAQRNAFASTRVRTATPFWSFGMSNCAATPSSKSPNTSTSWPKTVIHRSIFPYQAQRIYCSITSRSRFLSLGRSSINSTAWSKRREPVIAFRSVRSFAASE